MGRGGSKKKSILMVLNNADDLTTSEEVATERHRAVGPNGGRQSRTGATGWASPELKSWEQKQLIRKKREPKWGLRDTSNTTG